MDTFEQARADAYRRLGDIADLLRRDWPDPPIGNRRRALISAGHAITRAKDALNRAAAPLPKT